MNRRSKTLVAAAMTFSLSCVAFADEPAQVRTISRDTQSAGAPAVRLDDMAPYFDGELADALRAVDEGDGDDAVGPLDAWLAENGDDERAPLVRFALAYALYSDDRHEDAAPLLDACIGEGGPLIDYCLYWRADGELEMGDAGAAEALASTVDVVAVLGPRSRFLRARALEALGRHGDAVEAFEAFLAQWPSASYRTEVELALAASHEANGEFDDAARVYHAVALVNPGDSVERRANDALDEIRDRLSADVRRAVSNRSASEAVQRGRVLLARTRNDSVVELLSPVVATLDSAAPEACEANYLTGRALTNLRRHSDAVPYYDSAIDACPSNEDLMVRSLFNAGRSYWNADRDEEAFERYQRLYEDYAHNSYADDALLNCARIRRGNGDTDDSNALLEQQIDLFPEGDMLGDAVWLLMADRYGAGRFREAIEFADGLGTHTGEQDLYSRGRVGYFKARSQEQLSLVNEAKSGYAEVMRRHPMGFYALLSFNRLLEIDATMAADLLAELRAGRGEAEGYIRVDPPEVRQSPNFIRGTELLRMGLYDLAEGEFRRLREEYANHDEVGWLLSSILHRAGAYHLSHHVPGDRVGLNLDYPTEASRERWEIAYPHPFDSLVMEFAEQRSLDPWMVYAIMREESGFQPTIESWANARGLLQLMIGTARDMGALTGRGSVSERDLFDPAVNIELGTMYMRRLSDMFDGHPSLVIGGYNGGQGNIRSWLRARGSMPFDLWVEEIPYEQTRDYVKRVTMTYWVYRWLYAEGDPWVVLPFDLSAVPTGD
jgi:soluble lytic murein transglycosylase